MMNILDLDKCIISFSNQGSLILVFFLGKTIEPTFQYLCIFSEETRSRMNACLINTTKLYISEL